MLTFLVRRLFYGFTVLLGVVTLVFFLFTMVPDPSRELAGQTESEEVVESIRRKFLLDLPPGKRYLLFLNDLAPISLHSTDATARTYRETGELSGAALLTIGHNAVWIKLPYLGRSWLTERGVGAILREAFPGTFLLAILAMTFALFMGIGLGVLAALRKGSSLDRALLFVASIGMSGPSFFMAILIAWLFGYLWFASIGVSLWLVIIPGIVFILRRLKVSAFGRMGAFSLYTSALGLGALLAYTATQWMAFPGWVVQLPGTGLPMNGSLYEVDVWKGEQLALRHLILPVLTLGIRPLAVIVQLTRNSVLEVMSQDFVRTARAKGLNERQVIVRHVLRNAMNPVITAASGWLASMLAGAVFVEFVFGYKGLGMEVFRSLEKNDLPVVMGAVMVIAAIFVVINTLVDVIYGWIDPRVRLS
jgi:peptide/nickel transport system permease protein